jgi:hypothetical protein
MIWIDFGSWGTAVVDILTAQLDARSCGSRHKWREIELVVGMMINISRKRLSGTDVR